MQLEKTLKRICSICEKRAELAQRDSELTNGVCRFLTRSVLVRGEELGVGCIFAFPPRADLVAEMEFFTHNDLAGENETSVVMDRLFRFFSVTNKR